MSVTSTYRIIMSQLIYVRRKTGVSVTNERPLISKLNYLISSFLTRCSVMKSETGEWKG